MRSVGPCCAKKTYFFIAFFVFFDFFFIFFACNSIDEFAVAVKPVTVEGAAKAGAAAKVNAAAVTAATSAFMKDSEISKKTKRGCTANAMRELNAAT